MKNSFLISKNIENNFDLKLFCEK